MTKNRVYAVILAAGMGSRMGADITKQKMLLNGRTVISRTVGTFYECECIEGIVVVGRDEELDFLSSELSEYSGKIHAIVAGGDTRFESARIGFNTLPDVATHIAIHDGARPLVSTKTIQSVVDAAIKYGAATDACAIYDTVKSINKDGVITGTVDRSGLVGARTPQVFSAEIYARALDNSHGGEGITDDNMMVEKLGIAVHAVITNGQNPKITTMEDLKDADFLIKEREGQNV